MPLMNVVNLRSLVLMTIYCLSVVSHTCCCRLFNLLLLFYEDLASCWVLSRTSLWSVELPVDNRLARQIPYILTYLRLLVQAVGFLVDYVSHVTEVKDTVHKQTLICHVANIVLDQFPDTTDLYSDIGSVTRCAKVT